MKNNIDKLLELKGQSRYWLSKELNITYPNLKKLADNETTSIKFELMEKLCKALDCTLNDLFTLE